MVCEKCFEAGKGQVHFVCSSVETMQLKGIHFSFSVSMVSRFLTFSFMSVFQGLFAKKKDYKSVSKIIVMDVLNLWMLFMHASQSQPNINWVLRVHKC